MTDDPVDVDAHEGRVVGALRGGPDGPAEPGAVHQPVEQAADLPEEVGRVPAVVAADALAPGHHLTGPALLRSSYLTCLVDRGWSLRVSDNHDLIIEEA